MFTGIIEDVGKVRNIQRGAKSCVLTIESQVVTEGTNVGDSIAVNGVCLTVTTLSSGCFTADVMAETMRRTAFNELTVGSGVNLERAMQLGARLNTDNDVQYFKTVEDCIHYLPGHLFIPVRVQVYRKVDINIMSIDNTTAVHNISVINRYRTS